MVTVIEYIIETMKHKGISQRELALKMGIPYQNLSSTLKGERRFTVANAIKIDKALGLKAGTIARMQNEEEIEQEIEKMNNQNIPNKKRVILEKIKENGGLWSYKSIPDSLPEDDIIEEGLRHLDFEDMPMIFEIWSKAHIKRIWRERLVSEGRRMNVLNTLLGILFFDVKNINKYLERNCLSKDLKKSQTA